MDRRALPLAAILTAAMSWTLPACGESPSVPEQQSEESGSEAGHAAEPEPEPGSGGEAGESGTQYGLADTAEETRSGIDLVLRFDAAAETFTGAMTNTTTESVSLVRVEVHLSNGQELGPTPSVTLSPKPDEPGSAERQRGELRYLERACRDRRGSTEGDGLPASPAACGYRGVSAEAQFSLPVGVRLTRRVREEYLVYSDRNATMSGAKRGGSAGMDRRSSPHRQNWGRVTLSTGC